jgi:hypothetical protein
MSERGSFALPSPYYISETAAVLAVDLDGWRKGRRVSARLIERRIVGLDDLFEVIPLDNVDLYLGCEFRRALRSELNFPEEAGAASQSPDKVSG